MDRRDQESHRHVPITEPLEPRLLLNGTLPAWPDGPVTGADDGVVEGQVFEDVDQDRSRDPAETGLDGWTVELVDATSGAILDTQVTAGVDLDTSGDIDPFTESGLYSFSGVPTGRPVEVRVVIPDGWWQTTPKDETGGYATDIPAPAADPTEDHNQAYVAADGAGGIISTWWDPDGYQSTGVFAQRYGPDGAPLDVPFQVNTWTSGWQIPEQVAANASGDFVIVWGSEDQDGSDGGVYARRYGSDGVAQGDEFLVNTVTLGSQGGPAVAINDAGRFVIVWGSRDQDGDDLGVFGQRFDADGSPLGAEFQVNTYTKEGQSGPDVAMNNAGEFVVVWNSNHQDGGGFGVYGQRYNADGTRAGGEFPINTYTDNDQFHPSVACSESGGFIVGWESRSQDASGKGVYLRLFDADGEPVADEFNAAQGIDGWQANVVVAATEEGQFAAIWHSDSDLYGPDAIVARMFDTNGIPLSDEFLVCDDVVMQRYYSDIDLDGSGRIVTTWTEGQGSFDDKVIRLRQFDGFAGINVRRLELADGEVVSTAHVGMYQMGTVSGRVYDHRQLPGDTTTSPVGVDGVKVHILDTATGRWLGQRVTATIDLDGDGSIDPATETGLYRFDDLKLGMYDVRIDTLPGRTQESPGGDVHHIMVLYNQDVTGIDFSHWPVNGVVFGRVWHDLTGDGGRDPVEPGLDGRTVELIDASTGTFVDATVSAAIDLNGDGQIDPISEAGLYQFAILRSMAYEVRVVTPPGWVSTAPVSGSQTVVAGDDPAVLDVDFGSQVVLGDIQGQKWHDVNADGVHDVGDPGLDGWTVELVDVATGLVIDTAVTASVDLDSDGMINPIFESGLYGLVGTQSGRQYEVRHVEQSGWAFTYPRRPGIPIGGLEFQVNGDPAGKQRSPRIAMNASGEYAMVWSDEEYAIARVFDAAGSPTSPEILVGNGTLSISDYDVALDDAGNVALVWARGGGTPTFDTFAQLLDRAGSPLTAPFMVNSPCPYNQRRPAIAFDDQGRLLITWQGHPLAPERGIQGRTFALDGMLLGDAFTVHDSGAIPALAMNASGGFVVAWHDKPEGETHYRIYAQIHHADRTPAGDTFCVSDEQYAHQLNPRIAMDDSGRFAIVWYSDRHDIVGDDVRARTYRPDGTPYGEAFEVETTDTEDQNSPDVAMTPSGEFIIAWADSSPFEGDVIRGQLYQVDGTPVGTEWEIPTAANVWQDEPAVAINGNGDMLVAWHSLDADDAGVFARRYHIRPVHRFVVGDVTVHCDVDFGSMQTHTISGQVREDLLGDGSHDPTDPGVDEWTVELIDVASGAVVARQATVSADIYPNGIINPALESGLYWFEGVPAGVYDVRAMPRHDWVQTIPPAGDRRVQLADGLPAEGVSFAMAVGASVSGRVFEDIDGNGAADPGEPGMDGWTVELVDPVTGQVLDAVETVSRDVDGDGSIDSVTEMGLYSFEGLLPGDYQVRQVGQFGWIQSLPAAGGVYAISLAYAQAAPMQDFGNVAEAGEIRGQKWDDRDADGVHDADEPGLDGWTIELVNPDDGLLLASTATASVDLDGDGTIDPYSEMGLYSLGNLGRGDYVIREVPSDGWVATSGGQSAPVMLGTDIEVSVDTGERMHHPAAAGNGQGRYVVAWDSSGPDNQDIFVRVVDSRLGWMSNVVVANAPGDASDTSPAVAVADDGHFVVAWLTSESDGVEYHSYIDARLFAANGSPLADVFRIDNPVDSDQGSPSVAIADDGQFIITWNSERGNDDLIYARRFNADGTPAGDEYLVNSYLLSNTGGPSIAMNGLGESVIAWSAIDGGTGTLHDTDVYARRFDSSGTPVGDEFRVNVYSYQGQYEPSVALDNAGRCLIVWRSEEQAPRDTMNIFGRIFDAVGADVSGEFPVLDDLGYYQTAPAVTVDEYGRFLVAWQGFGEEDYGMYARTVLPDGTPDGPAVKIDRTDYSYRGDAQVAAIGPGCFVSIYRGDDDASYTYGIHAARVYTAPTRGVMLDDGEVATDIDFGNIQTAVVSGQAWEDRSLDNLPTGNEPGLDLWKILAIDSATGFVVAQSQVQSVDLDGDGTLDPATEVGLYALEGLLPGQYDIQLDLADGWVQSWPPMSAWPVTVASGGTTTGVNFAAVPEVTVEGRLVEDLDGDGAWTAGEPGLDAWTIRLANAASGQVVATTMTDSIDLDGDGLIDPTTESGFYRFDGLLPGSYHLHQVLPAGWVQTLPATPEYALDLTYAEHRTQMDFAAQALPSEIRGQIWHDTDLDGLRSPGEVGIDGKGVMLIDQDTGNIVTAQLTASVDLDGDGMIDPATEQGLYAFTNLPRGRYLVRQLVLGDAQWRQSAPARPAEIQDLPLEIQGADGPSQSQAVAIAANESGRSVAAWWDHDYDADQATLRARVYHADGSLARTTFAVNVESAWRPQDVRVAINDDGRFVVAWIRGLEEADPEIRARVYDENGFPVTGDILVPGTSTYRGYDLDVAIDDAGGFVVTWQRAVGSNDDVLARRFDAAGVPVDDVFQVNTYMVNDQLYPVIAMDDSGAFVIAWTSSGQDGSGSGVYGQMYHADGTVRGGEFRANTTTSDSQWDPSIAMSGVTGEFIIAWESEGQDLAGSYDSGIYAQRYAADGTPIGGETALQPYDGTYEQSAPTVRMLDSGRFALMWHGTDGDPAQDWHVQWYSADGTAEGDAQALRRSNEYESENPTIAISGSSDVLIVWEYDLDRNGYSLAATRRATDFVPREVELQVDHVVTGADFAGYHSCLITGRAYHDMDLDGSVDPAEPGLDDWVIALVDAHTGTVLDLCRTEPADLNGDGSIDPVTETGIYAFDGLRPGDYLIALGESRGLWTVIDPNGGRLVSLQEGAAATGLDLPLADVPAPRVTASSVLIGDEMTTTSFTIDLEFDHVLDAAALDETDFTLVGEVCGNVSPVSWSYDPVASTLALQYANIPDDLYQLTLLSGDDRFEGAYGWDLDGEANAATTVPSGDGVPGGPFSVSFTVDIDHTALAPMMTPVAPLGSLAYRTDFTGRLPSSADTDSYTLELNTGQMLTIAAEAIQSELSVELRDGTGTPVVPAASIVASGIELLEAMVPASGTYTLHVSTPGVGQAAYAMDVAVNATLERELYDNQPHEDWLSAQSLDGQFVPLAGAPDGAEQATVIGFHETWHTFAAGRTSVGNLFYPHQTVMLFDSLPPADGPAVVTVRAIGDLDWLDERLDVRADGVYIGGPQYWPPGTDTETLEIPQATLIDLLADGAITFTIQPSSTVGDEGPTELTVTLSYPVFTSGDVYNFALAADEAVSVIASPIGAGAVDLELFDADGDLLVSASAVDTNVGQVIAAFSAPTSGEYYVRVRGQVAAEYSLIVQRQAMFDVEPNDEFVAAQPIPLVGAVAGALDGSADLYGILVNDGDSLTLTTATPGWHAGATASDLDPAIELYDPSGVLLTGDDDGLDGRNARIDYAAQSTGMYVVRVYAVEGRGEYVLAMTGHTGGVLGDVDGDLDVDADDIDRLHLRINEGATDPRYDLTGDGAVDAADADRLIYDILQSAHGDADLNGAVDLDDFVVLKLNFSQSGRGWAEGDYDGTGHVDLDDCVLLKVNFATGLQPSVPVTSNLLAGSIIVKHRSASRRVGALPPATDDFDLLTQIRRRSFRSRRAAAIQSDIDQAIDEDIFRLI